MDIGRAQRRQFSHPTGVALLGLIALPLVFAGACAAGRAPNGFGVGGGTTGDLTGAGGLALDAGLGTGGAPLTADPTTCAEAAATKAYVGCDFWPTVVANLVDPIFDYAVVVGNAGDQPADVTVTYQGTTLATAHVLPSALATVYLPWVATLKGSNDPSCNANPTYDATVRADAGAYHLVASRPVTVYQFNALEYKGAGGPPGKDWSTCSGLKSCDGQPPTGCYSYTNDASLLLPSTAMTGNYRITAEQDGVALGDLPGYIAVTGTKDGTTVTVYVAPGGHVVAGGGVPDTAGGGSLSFTLDAGDVMELFSDGKSDLAGSLVKASAPVQVISGTPCSYEPVDGTYPACDHLEETVLPAETLGRHYFVASPTTPDGKVVGQVVRIVGNVDGTKLTYPAGIQPADAPDVLDAGQVVDLGLVTNDFEIQGDHEFAVATFMLGATLTHANGSGIDAKGDPSQSLAVPVEQYRQKYVFLTPADYDVSYVDVVQPMDAKVSIDGAPSDVTPVWIGSGFGIARVELGPGNNGAHVLTASKPVGIQVMGYGSYTSYQYPGGLNLTSIAPPPPTPH